ncbi:two-component sensor histidine kinase [Actinoplanes ianthinogenes]|uniref:histidine kinase n=1 Tax=Actinoplanes ianthinogenes TaxID=122358 RepID=A0ABM7M688_9ACTN|nr:histidine kinase [Actinoplanes ianthinogenes]BCJ47099.1 two-component sensor histidine kinase [Actinoplanes ianthinogenes]GGR51681.1 two-component sensor histidine kinase [Actinoplanes ianthinogenes]
MSRRRKLIQAALVAVAAFDVWFGLGHDKALDISIGVVACVAVLFRHRFPLVAFLLTVPAVLTQAALVAPFATLYSYSAQSRNRRRLIGCAVVAALAAAVPSPLADDPVWDSGNIVTFGYALGTAVLPILLGQLVQTRYDLRQRIVEIERAKEKERVRHAEAVLARERAQLAREMHDVVSHQVSLIAVQAGALQVVSADPAVKEAARTIRRLSSGTLDELRGMVALLRASSEGHTPLTPQPTLADLPALIEASGIKVEFEGDLDTEVGTPAQRALYRTVQEALTNVRKHAPDASAEVELWRDDAHVGVTVTNSPPSRPALPLPGSHLGLIGLRERAELLHGTVESGHTEDGGFRVRMRLPLSGDVVQEP